MKIAESAMQTSSHTAIEFFERRESLTVWQQGNDPIRTDQDTNQNGKLEAKALAAAEQATKISLSVAARQKIPQSAELDPLSDEDRLLTDLNMRILQALFEKLTGRKFKLYDPGMVKQEDVSATVSNPGQSSGWADGAKGWGGAVRAPRNVL